MMNRHLDRDLYFGAGASDPNPDEIDEAVSGRSHESAPKPLSAMVKLGLIVTGVSLLAITAGAALGIALTLFLGTR